MGSHKSIGVDTFPAQGSHLGKTVEVCFRYDTTNLLAGRIVRDDREDPWMTIIALDDGRYLLATECMYSVRR